ncbi:iron uptake porin [Scytonema sp. UIC 10036]|uniref:iron uptake porin n=1 Tax=Scytonema sp. UIC 10036 TaxID=2304196 RepID=UPI00140F92C7|nr:iron uptake porin [Scytonema sp. UIC 10036]
MSIFNLIALGVPALAETSELTTITLEHAIATEVISTVRATALVGEVSTSQTLEMSPRSVTQMKQSNPITPLQNQFALVAASNNQMTFVSPITTTVTDEGENLELSLILVQKMLENKDSHGLIAQVTSVSQLEDVQPTDWAFQSLQSLVERYGCIAGYPENVYRGNRALTRYEFAAGLNACLKRVNELIATATSDLARTEDLVTIKRLQEEFAAELTVLRGRVDTLEARSAELEANQFSTTTKLTGQVIMAVNAGAFDGERIISPTGQEIARSDPNATVLYRAALDLNTSFSGSDQLKIRIDTGSDNGNDNTAGFLEPTFGSVLDYSVKPPRDNDFGLGRLYYTFKPFQNFTVSVGPDIRTTDYVDRNSYAYLSFRDFSTLAFVNNYILFPVNGPSAGAAIDWKPGGGAFTVRALYAAAEAANPTDRGPIRGTAPFARLLYPTGSGEQGLFGDTYQSTVELEYAPSKSFAIRLQYSGGELFDNRYDVFGANFELAFSPKFAIFGRYGFSSYNETIYGDINPNYWMAGVAFRDLFTQGALAGIAAGQPFIASELGNSTQTNFEGFYNFPVSNNIQVTPLIQVIVNPSNQDANGTIITGTLRTVFSF